MRICSYGSGSKGNCYHTLFDSGLSVMLDCGVRLASINKKINFNSLDFLFVSHEHKDHSLNREGLMRRGVSTIYGGSRQGEKVEVFEIVGKKSRATARITLVPIKHGEVKNRAIVIESGEECLLYATDFSVCEWALGRFEFTHIMVECNFVESYIQATIENQPEMAYKLRRQINTHMGLVGLLCFLEPLNLSKVEDIILIHKSQNLANSTGMDVDMVTSLMKTFKKNIAIAKPFGGFDIFEYIEE